MAPLQHSEFDELCALAATGELSADELERLREHLTYCDLCRKAIQEHTELRGQIAAALVLADDELASGAAQTSEFDVEAGERRLMESLKKKSARKSGSYLASLLFVFISTAITCFASAVAWHEHEQRVAALRPTSMIPTTHESRAMTPTSPKRSPQREPSKELATLREQVEQATRSASLQQQQLFSLQQDLRAVQQENEQLRQQALAVGERSDSLTHQLANAQNDAASLRQQLSAATLSAQTQAREQAQHLDLLQSALDEKNRTIAQNDEFLSHDRDIRDLMGARNLIIEDIYDVGEDGRKQKPVGRIFYTKDKRLLFYGYELDKQRSLKQNVVFQAWGNNQSGTNVNLGVFYRDDANKRWVLKYSDASTLARLTSIFVTVEPAGGSTKPSGKHLLNASLRIDPNYP